MKFLQLFEASVQNLINLGFPREVASYWLEYKGKDAYQLAAWYREMHEQVYGAGKGWWSYPNREIDGPKDHRIRSKYGPDTAETQILLWDFVADASGRGLVPFALTNAEADRFWNDVLDNGVRHYKGMPLIRALEKFGKSMSQEEFSKYEVVDSYPDGFKWVDVGVRNNLVAEIMSNCGNSAGQFPEDNHNQTILLLVNDEWYPVVMMVRSEDRSGGIWFTNIEGKAGSEPKPQYLKYVKALQQDLNASTR